LLQVQVNDKMFCDTDNQVKTKKQLLIAIFTVLDGLVIECCWRPSQLGPHQVIHEAIATLLRSKRA